jgi:hypothetical protein
MFGRYSQVFADAVLRNDRLARWNDRLSFWWVGAIFGWAAFGVLLFWPILHLGFGAPTIRVVFYLVIAACLQAAVTPWLFVARSTKRNIVGRVGMRRATVIVWLLLNAALFFYIFVKKP